MPCASCPVAVLNVVNGGVVSHTEARRHGAFGVSSAAGMVVSCPTDFMKTAGERKPHFIKCGFGEAEETAVELEVA